MASGASSTILAATSMRQVSNPVTHTAASRSAPSIRLRAPDLAAPQAAIGSWMAATALPFSSSRMSTGQRGLPRNVPHFLVELHFEIETSYAYCGAWKTARTCRPAAFFADAMCGDGDVPASPVP